jgi:cytoskeleton protein RodZ
MSEQGHPDGVIEIRDLQRRRGAGKGRVMAPAKSTALSHDGPANDPGGRSPRRSEPVESRGTSPNTGRSAVGAAERRGGDPAGAPSVGAIFRRRREEYGLAVDDIEADLCIRKGYLEAIETGDYDILPGTTYALGFVRAYADHIGLDAEQMVRRFKVEALGEPAPVQAGGAATAVVRKRRSPVVFVAGAIAIAVAAGLGGWTLSTMDLDGDVAAVPAPAADTTPAAAAPTPVIETAAAAPDPSVPPTAGESENGALPPFAVPAPNGQAPAADLVDAEPGADFRLTPRPKGRPIPTGAVLAVPSPSAGQTAPTVAATAPAAAATPAIPPAPIPTAVPRSAAAAPAVAVLRQDVAPPPADTNPPTQQAAVAPAPTEANPSPQQAPPPPTSAEDNPSAQPTTAPPAQQAAVPPAVVEKAKEPEKKAEKQPETRSNVTDRPTVVYGTPGRARVAFTAVDTTRIRIHSTGGEVLFDGVLLPGDVYRVPDRPGLMLMTESAGGLKFTVDGNRAPAIGPKGALRHNVFLNPMLLREGRAAPH